MTRPSLGLSSWAICDDLYYWLVDNVECGSTVLELGSGEGTQKLAEHFTVVSVEHDPTWVGRFDSTYIHAPLVKGPWGLWYDVGILREFLPRNYDVLLVDGPPGHKGRDRFFHHMDLFDTSVLLVIDDVHRDSEMNMFESVCAKLRRSGFILGGRRKFGIISPRK